MVIVKRVDAPLPGEERIGHIDPRKSLLIFGLLVTELDLLQGQQIEVGLLEQLQFFIGVAHDPGLLALQRLAREVGVIVGVGADLADIRQLNRLAQLHLSRLHQHGGLGLEILVLAAMRLVLAHKIIISINSQPTVISSRGRHAEVGE